MIAAPAGEAYRLFEIHGDSIRPAGVLAPMRAYLLLTAADEVGVWSANSDRYVLRRHTWPGGVGDLEDFAAESIWYRDIVIEAFTPAGRLVASVRFDSFRDAPHPMQYDLWYRRTPDELSVVILEAFLAERSDVPTGPGRQR